LTSPLPSPSNEDKKTKTKMKGRYKVLITFLIIIGGFWGFVIWINFDLIITGEREEIAEYRYEGTTPKEREDLYYEKNPSHKIIGDVSSGEETKRREELKQKLAEQDQKYSNAKNELNNYLQSVEKSTSECNRVPNSVKISSLVEKEVDEIVINSALMVILIEEAPSGSGLLPYKQKIITAVDELIECLNRH